MFRAFLTAVGKLPIRKAVPSSAALSLKDPAVPMKGQVRQPGKFTPTNGIFQALDVGGKVVGVSYDVVENAAVSPTETALARMGQRC